MKAQPKVLVFMFLTSLPTPASTYELATHAAMTQRAYQVSVLQRDTELLKELGISDAVDLLGDVYHDSTGSELRQRQAQEFEGVIIERARAKPLALEGWLLRGAIREDDWTRISIPGCAMQAPNPQDDPYPNPPDRPKNHFYDPFLDRPLTVLGLTQGRKAPDWAIGAIDALSQPNAVDQTRRNHFTVFDAREAMYRALTGKDSANADAAKSRQERNRYWATAIRALGDVVHLIQDMGQSQHTRNDTHSGACIPAITGHASVYEHYIDARATGDLSHNIDGSITTFLPLNYADYPVPRFTKYGDFFSTARRDGVEQGLGLSDYSNRGFFTVGTNLGDNTYPLPSNNREHYIEQVINVEPNTNTRTAYLLDAVFDTQNPALRALDVPKTKESLWYEPLFEFSERGVAERFGYTLDQRIYDAQANLLIPRAVAYSAGLIDYFFRGRLETEDVTFSEKNGQVEVSLKVRNAIDAEKVSEWAGESLGNRQGAPSQFVLTVKYKQGEEEKLIASDPVGFRDPEPIKPGETSKELYTFSLPTLSEGATDIEYRIVFRGRLGQEDDAIAVGIVEQVSGFVVVPNYLPADQISGSRLIERSSGRWRLSEDRNILAANIDWKGDYVNGRPTKVLTWWGPSARYFPDPPPLPSPFRQDIYQNGERFAVAPRPVLGAAISRDTDGKEWLVAICTDGAADIVYKRPNEKSTSPALFDPVTQPDGWRELGRFDWKIQGFGTFNVPWFFNGKGIEAQTIRIRAGWRRIKFTLSDDSAVASDEGNLEGISGGRVETRVCNQETYGDSQAGCQGNCAGVAVFGVLSNIDNYDSETTSTGKLIIAVDYIDHKPVFATYSQEARVTERIHKDGRQDFRFVCSRDRFGSTSICSDPSNYAFTENTRTVERTFDIVTEIVVPGAPAIVITSQKGTRRLDEVGGNESLGGQLVASKDERVGFSDLQESQRHIIYLDLRGGVYVLYERNAKEMGTGDVFQSQTFPSNFFVETDTTVQTGQRIEVLTKTIPVNANPPFVESGLLGRRFIVDWGSPLPIACGETKSTNFSASLQPFLRTLKSSGSSWAVDSAENLFVSMAVLGDDPAVPTGATFNFITNGDLRTIIPPGPSGARYHPGAVVR